METTLLNNRYRILQLLGRGGFGQTFLAVDTHMPSARKCAIKQLQPLVQPKMQQWVQASFQREAATLEQLGEGHEQIPRLYAYFAEAGDFYLVQEWIEGVTLQELAQQDLSAEKVKAILGGILPVLAFVHSRRILHRDIKPENIILRPDGKPVLIDFGAVKEAIATAVEGGHTATIAVGTPGYMASEQAAGRPLFSSDLYSLGLTAVYLLVGKSPQELETNPRTGEILWQKDASGVDSHLAAVINRAIQFHPKDRFASAGEMLEALYPATTPTVVVSPRVHSSSARRSPPKTDSVPPPQRTAPSSNGLTCLLPLLLLTIIGGIAFAVGFNWFSAQQSPSTSRPVEPSPELEPLPEDVPQQPEGTTTPEPLPAVPPEPEPPKPKSSPPLASPGRGNTVPTFTPGTTQDQVLAALGEPTSNQQGYWPGSRAWLYRAGSAQADLGLVFDTNTGRLRQTEVTFAPSADLATMQDTLKQMLGGTAPSAASQGLSQIYQRQNDLRSFEVGNLKGMIRRNQLDRIYIGIWEADFH